MIYRYQLKQSELILLDRSGDTLAISKLPESLPASLYKDFLTNVHYFSNNGNAYQCFFNEHHDRIEFFKKTTVDSLFSHVKPFLFQLSDRLYFQEKLVKGFGTAIGFYQKGTGKKYIKQCVYDNKISEYFDDKHFIINGTLFEAKVMLWHRMILKMIWHLILQRQELKEIYTENTKPGHIK